MSDALNQVLTQGMCIGCGACSALDPRIEIGFDAFGRYVANPNAVSNLSHAGRVCPFSDDAVSEDELSSELFGAGGPRDSQAGFHLASFAGWVEEGEFRDGGSSGGMATWLCSELLERGLVDRIVHVSERSGTAGTLFSYRISETAEEVRSGAKSRYYPVEMSQIIRRMRMEPARYAVVGVPCFIKALRLLSRELPEIRERITFAVGIVCGHLKSAAFAELLAWQCGIEPGSLGSIDFRTKLPGRPASKYGVTVRGRVAGKETTVTRPMQGLLGADWGQGLFKYKACDFCDDVLAETADIVFGDAWLPEYENDSRGTNVILVRRTELVKLLRGAAKLGRLHLEEVPVNKVVESQAGGFRHRRDGLAFRLWLEDQAGRWRPKKRVQPSFAHLTPKLRRIHKLRHRISQTSHAAFSEAKRRADLNYFAQAMEPLMRRYRRIYLPSFPVRVWRKLRRMMAGEK